MKAPLHTLVAAISIALIAEFVSGAVLAADIVGTAGPDVLEGTQDADKIDGKGGADVMMGLAGDDTFIVGQADDEVLEAVGDGTDTVRSTVSYTLPINVENLTLNGSAPINATGNSLANRLTGNTGNNMLSGRAGADRMFGRSGDDTYIVDAAGDVVNEALDEGTDLVRSTVTYTLPANVENLSLRGSAAINGTGNDLRNAMTGNTARNVLRGMGGDDTLNGGGGNDRLLGGLGRNVLTGGTGQDDFEFDLPPNPVQHRDVIIDFSPIDDRMRLIGAAFPALNTAGTLEDSAFGIGIVASESAVRILYDPATGVIRYDADGSGPTPASPFATLSGAPAVTNANFVVVNPVLAAVDYSEIQDIFTSRCIGCHSGGAPPQGLHLDAANSFDEIVDVPSNEVPSLKRVDPGDPDNSYLVQKVEGTAAVGSRMPLNATPLTEEEIALIRRWISEGANP